jgi:hypothetical protein
VLWEACGTAMCGSDVRPRSFRRLRCSRTIEPNRRHRLLCPSGNSRARQDLLHNAASQQRKGALRYGITHRAGDGCRYRRLCFWIAAGNCPGVLQEAHQQLPLSRAENSFIRINVSEKASRICFAVIGHTPPLICLRVLSSGGRREETASARTLAPSPQIIKQYFCAWSGKRGLSTQYLVASTQNKQQGRNV